jgi:LmbE family N-acetylglucosaminyl deacetylase
MRDAGLVRAARRRIRRILHRGAALALRLRSRRYPLEAGAVTLVFAPHQDDGTLGCGGLILLKQRMRLAVRIAYLTDGSHSHPGHPILSPADIAKLRRSEAEAAAGVLGVGPSALFFLDAPDGRLDRLGPAERDTLVGKIAAVVSEVRPDEILLPYRKDRSSEHEAGFTLVMEGIARSGAQPRVLEYPIWSWWDPRALIKPLLGSGRVWRAGIADCLEQKLLALRCYASQIEPTPPWADPVLPRSFLSYFSSGEEFFFEIDAHPFAVRKDAAAKQREAGPPASQDSSRP